MKSLKIALATVIALTAAAPAFAGTSVTNSTTVRKVYGGTGSVTTNLNRVTSGVQINTSQSLKMEADGGTRNIVNVGFNGHKLTGTAHSSNTQPIDPYAIGTYSSQYERLNVTETLNVNAVETYNFRETMRDHTVSSDSF